MTTLPPPTPIPPAPIPPAPEPSRRAVRLAAAPGWYAYGAGLLSFMGWVLGVRRLTAWGGAISIQPNAALAATAAGAGLVLLAHGRRRAVVPFAALTGLIGLATLFEHVSGVDLGIDALLTFGRPWTGTATVAPGRMGPPASICWTLLGFGMLLALAGRQARQAAAALGLATMVLGSLSFIGYLFGADPLYAIAPLTAIALQTATMVLAAGAALVAALPDTLPMRTLTERSAAGLLARRAMPFVVLVPVALGLLTIQGRRAEWFDRGLGYSLIVLAFIVTMTAVLWWCVGAVRDHERALADASRTVQENETRLRQAAKMEAIGRLAGGVAHDFNNQLSAVMGFASFAARDGGMSEQARGDLQEVIKATERMAGVTRQLLAFSRQQVLQPETLQLNAAVLDGCALLQRLIGTDIEMRLDLTSDPTWVRVDRAQLLQVLMNLAINARDAMPKGGSLGIRTARVEDPEPAGTYVLLAVSDNGAGIRAEHLPHIFEPFFTTKEQGQGTGLGLATVHGIVSQSRGQIRVETRAGEGSEFTVLFPAVPAPPDATAGGVQGTDTAHGTDGRTGADGRTGTPGHSGPVGHTDQTDERPASLHERTAGGEGHPPATDAQPAPGDGEPAPPRRSARLLVVDDEDALRWMVSRMLQEEGYEVVQARNGREALERLAEGGRVDLVLTDVVMPVLGGRDLAERIAADYPGLPVIWMSGHPHDTAFADAGPGGGSVGAYPFLQKPTPADVLVRTVAGALARETAAPQSA